MADTPAPAAVSDPVVHLDGVSVIYGKNEALKGVTAKFARGAVGLLGPNGAGKSTMLKALLGFVKPSRGRMTVLGSCATTRSRSAPGSATCREDAHIRYDAVSFVAIAAARGTAAG